MNKPRTITTFLIDGNPVGFRKIYFTNTKVLGFFISRKELEKIKNREELTQSGVYFLIGKSDDEKNLVYIGQAINLKERVRQHYSDNTKDYWNAVIFFTTTDGSWNESDINFLERTLIREARKNTDFIIKNGNSGNNTLATEEKIADLTENIEDIKILVGSLGVTIFQEKITKEEMQNKYFAKRRGANAWGYFVESGFIIAQGSEGVLEYLPSASDGLKKKRKELLKNGVYIIREDKIIFQKDFLCTSPSLAAGIVLGGSMNGWEEWKTIDGKTLNEIERIGKF